MPTLKECPLFLGQIHVYHSAITLYHAPSDLCGMWGMHQQRICSTPCVYGRPCHDTVLVDLGDNSEVMKGMMVAHIKLIYSFHYSEQNHTCMLVNWFVPNCFDDDTGLWMVCPERDLDQHGQLTVNTITLDSIVWGVHLLLVYGETWVPPSFDASDALDAFKLFFVNKFIDYHAHELLLK